MTCQQCGKHIDYAEQSVMGVFCSWECLEDYTYDHASLQEPQVTRLDYI